MVRKIKNKKRLMLVIFYYTSGLIFGPLILFGFGGYYLDKKLKTEPLYMLIGIGAAFIFTNILAIKKIRATSDDIYKIVKRDAESEIKNNLNGDGL